MKFPWTSGSPLRRRAVAMLAIGAATLAALAPAAALAHGGPTSGGLVAGLAHPLGGIDHLLAMVAVGLWASRQGGRFWLLIPIAFVAMMLTGGAAALAGLPLPLVELGIAGSLCLLGLAVMLDARPPLGAALAVVGALAVLHGHAHGAEIPAGATAVAYGLGFALATAGLHGLGIGLGWAFKGALGVRLAGGGALALVGLWLLAGIYPAG